MRNALPDNQTITLASLDGASRSRTFTILETLGSGSSCVAYRAVDARTDIPAIVKECFPRNSATRDGAFGVIWNSPDDESCAKDRFRNAYDIQLRIQKANDTMNWMNHLNAELYTGNNTLCRVSEASCAKLQTFTLSAQSFSVGFSVMLRPPRIEARSAIGIFHIIHFSDGLAVKRIDL